DRLRAISPGAYTASYYGVPGALNIRGTLAETYFRGFKRLENRGTYATPLGDAAQVEIIRGPPAPAYGPGKVGGLVNFTTKTARAGGQFPTQPFGDITVTGGGYGRWGLAAEGAAPLSLGAARGGLHVYGEMQDLGGYYRGIRPRRQVIEASAEFDLGGGW